MVPPIAMLSRTPARIALVARVVPVIGLALTVAGGPLACGPSLQRVEQANVFFERCHAADRDPVRSDAERRACWRAWRDHYEVGQPDDRVDYVRERLVMLDPASGDAISLAMTDESMVDETVGPSSEPAPPEGPELSDSVGDRPPRARRRPVAPRTRTSACGMGCEPAFVECASECRVADRGCTDACRHVFRQCARGCF